jgi:ceramide glucosyltransferase
MELSLRLFSDVIGAVTACGIAYLIAALIAAIRAGARYVPAPMATPPVTLLKPVHGLDVELFKNLCSFCEQEYPLFQVIFGVQRSDDPAIAVIRRVIERYPKRDLTLIVADGDDRGNPKIANVMNTIGGAKYDLLVITDADMRVGPGYLSAIAAAFDDPYTGAATCLYAGVPRGGFASRLAALQMDDQFAPSVLVATMLQPLAFCFGSTMAVRRSVLAEIGGLEALREQIADDYMLGALVHARGHRVALSPYVVHNVVEEESVGSVWRREVRWARVIRSVRPAGFAMSFVTFPLPFALLLLALPGHALTGAAAVAIVLALRAALHAAMRALFYRSDPTGAPRLGLSGMALVPMRELFGFAVWCGGFLGRRVHWRHRELKI